MKIKLALIVIGFLAIFLIITHNYIQEFQNRKVLQRIIKLEKEEQNLKKRIEKLLAEKNRLEETKKLVDKEFKQQFNDPEATFLSFLDHLQKLNLQRYDGEITMEDAHTFRQEPVRLYEINFLITFKFIDPRKAENILKHILQQQDPQQSYPIKVRHLTITREKGGKPLVSLSLALLVPERADH